MIDVTDRIFEDFGDLLRIRCACGAELDFVYRETGWRECECGRRYRVSWTVKAEMERGGVDALPSSGQ